MAGQVFASTIRSSRKWGPASPAKLRSALLFEWLGFEAPLPAGWFGLIEGKTGETAEIGTRFRWLPRRSSEQNINIHIYLIFIFSLYFLILLFTKRGFTKHLARSS
jgi:hypothetical protein